MERKLAAILAADVAGYSRLMGVDEEGTLNSLRVHRELLDGLIAAHRGRVFNSAGDSVVAEFPSAVEATQCAVEIQQEIARRNASVPKNRRLDFRIGLNIGDVMVEGGNLFGDGVNVADRVQKLAEPGGSASHGTSMTISETSSASPSSRWASITSRILSRRYRSIAFSSRGRPNGHGFRNG